MNAPVKIAVEMVVPLDAETSALVERLASQKGMTTDQYASEAIRRVVETDADYQAFLHVGIDQLDRGEGIPHEQVMAELDEMIARRQAQCSK